MDLNQIAIFVRVVEAGSFSGAAKQMNVPVSTVSYRVAKLEKRLGINLLQRTTRKISLTQAGQIYFDHVSKGFVHFNDAETSISDIITTPRGKLKISAPFDIGIDILSNFINEMNGECPDVTLKLILTKRYVDLVAEGIDVAIRTGPLQDSTLVAKLIGFAKWQIFSSPDYFISNPNIDSPQQLNQHYCLQFTPLGENSLTLRNSNSSQTVLLGKSVLADDINLIKAMALNGDGIAILPSYQCQNEIENNKLIRVLSEWYVKEDPVYIVFPNQKYMAPQLRLFIDIAAKHLRRSLDF